MLVLDRNFEMDRDHKQSLVIRQGQSESVSKQNCPLCTYKFASYVSRAQSQAALCPFVRDTTPNWGERMFYSPIGEISSAIF